MKLDKSFSLWCRRLGEKAKLECIEKAGHLTLLERPWVYNAHLMQILASLATDQR